MELTLPSYSVAGRRPRGKTAGSEAGATLGTQALQKPLQLQAERRPVPELFRVTAFATAPPWGQGLQCSLFYVQRWEGAE